MDTVTLQTLAGIAGVLCEKDEPIIILTTDDDHLMVTAAAGCDHAQDDPAHDECRELLVTMLETALNQIRHEQPKSTFYSDTTDGTITEEKPNE